MLPTIKVYKINYEFIISNYLDVSLWQKIWTLFVYKDCIFTIQLMYIDTIDMKITFKIKCNKVASWWSETVTYFLNSYMTVDMLKNKINSAVWNLMLRYEKDIIEETDCYDLLITLINTTKDRLTDEGNELCDEKGIETKCLRDAFIDAYVDDGLEYMNDQRDKYVNICKYRFATDMLLEFSKAIGSAWRIREIKDTISDKCAINNFMKKIVLMEGKDETA